MAMFEREQVHVEILIQKSFLLSGSLIGKLKPGDGLLLHNRSSLDTFKMEHVLSVAQLGMQLLS